MTDSGTISLIQIQMVTQLPQGVGLVVKVTLMKFEWTEGHRLSLRC